MVLRNAFDGDVGHCKLALGTIPHRIDNGDPRDRCCVDGFRGGEGTGSTGKSRPKVVESGRDPHLYKRGDWTGIRRSARNRVWAAAYLWLGALDSPTDALLFSVDSMSTRGASGLTLRRHWQMMGALEAVDGILLFGVSAAYIFAVMQAYWSMLAARVTPSKS
jgi:hypothetical protein